MAVSKRLRYEVLRRDNYTCRYCGAGAPDVKLVVDAVIPEALGGSHKDPANLVAACDPCNSGKTSSNPDAPLVTNVADDALRWAQAIQLAQARMLADLNAREAGRQQFAEWWDKWGYEQDGKRHSIPRPPAWELGGIDQIVAAGLPLRALEDCIDLAMTRTKVANDQKFRYMCGIAWNKVTELQQAARESLEAGLDDPATYGEDAEDAALQDWCRGVLGQRDPDVVKLASRTCFVHTGESDPASVLWFVIRILEGDREALNETLRDERRGERPLAIEITSGAD